MSESKSESDKQLLADYAAVSERAAQDPEGFWREQAERIEWFEFPKTILSKDDNGADRWYAGGKLNTCLLYTSPSPRDATLSRMPSSA